MTPSRIPSTSENTKAHPRQQQRGGQTVQNQCHDGDLIAVGIAEIAGQDAFEIRPELPVERLIEAELGAQLGDELGVAGSCFTRKDGGGIARRHVDQHEVQDHDPEHDHNRFEEALKQEIERFQIFSPDGGMA